MTLLRELMSKFDDAVANTQATLAKILADLGTIAAGIQANGSQVQDLKTQLSAATAQVADLTAKLASETAANADLTTKLAAANTEIASLQASAGGVTAAQQTAVDALATSAATISGQADAIASSLAPPAPVVVLPPPPPPLPPAPGV